MIKFAFRLVLGPLWDFSVPSLILGIVPLSLGSALTPMPSCLVSQLCFYEQLDLKTLLALSLTQRFFTLELNSGRQILSCSGVSRLLAIVSIPKHFRSLQQIMASESAFTS